MGNEIIWVQDLFDKETGLNSVLQMQGSVKSRSLSSDGKFSLIGKCSGLNEFSISHEYTNNSKLQNILNHVNKIKSKLGNAEIDLELVKSISKNVGGDNLIAQNLNKLADWSQDQLREVFGDSANYMAIKNLEATVRYWNNTMPNMSLPTFEMYFYPKIENNLRIISTIDQASGWIDYMVGKYDKITDETFGKLGKWISSLGSVNASSSIPWYSYRAPNGYGPRNIDYTKLDKPMEGTFSLNVRGLYKIENLLIKELKVSVSETLIKDNGKIYPSWIRFQITFERSIELTVNDIRKIFKLNKESVL